VAATGANGVGGTVASHDEAARGLVSPAAGGDGPLIGVLALQGAFAEHLAMLRRIGARARLVRLPGELAEVDALVIPGGESTTIGKLLVDYALLEPLRERVRAGLPVFGTCAGAIMLARDIGRDQPLLGVMDMVVERNAFGRQLQSFEADLPLQGLAGPPLRAVFIRAPVIAAVGPGVQVLARLPDGRIVAARQGPLLATAFHPELTDDQRLHRLFVREVAATRS
jgi:5'-phosphate synthase pdxT subunit